MMILPTLNDQPKHDYIAPDLKGKRIWLRLDLNVPIKNGVVGDKTRIERSLPTIKFLLDQGAKLAIASHLGRPKGKPNPEFSLRPLLAPLEEALGINIGFSDNMFFIDPQKIFKNHQLVLLENLRFFAEEEQNDLKFAAKLAQGFDFYVNDAFSCAHRAHASVHAITNYLPSLAGLNLAAEVNALTLALDTPHHPVMAVVGGAKISSKITVLEYLIDKLDYLVIGGGMANSFLATKGVAIGKSLSEPDMYPIAEKIMEKAQAMGCEILLPCDAAVANSLEAGQARLEKSIHEIDKDDLILDVGAKTIADLKNHLAKCATLLWNGPMGVFEIEPFDIGTNALARAAGEQKLAGKLISVAGGGDTLAALNHAFKGQDLDTAFSYISTAGGAFLEWIEGRELPGITALKL